MIEKLLNNDQKIAQEIFSIFQSSYAVEAEILNAINFPPLLRPLENYINCSTEFFGYFFNQKLVGVVEINPNIEFTHIQSLVVSPNFFQRGIGSKLMEFVIEYYDSSLFVVETGLDNKPAIALYKKFGFVEVHQWDTDHGVRKVKFEKIINNVSKVK